MPIEARDGSVVDALDEVATLGVGLGLIVFVLFPLTVPMIALTLLLAVPLVPVLLAACLLGAPVVLVRRLARRGTGGSR